MSVSLQVHQSLGRIPESTLVQCEVLVRQMNLAEGPMPVVEESRQSMVVVLAQGVLLILGIRPEKELTLTDALHIRMAIFQARNRFKQVCGSANPDPFGKRAQMSVH